MEVLDHDPTPDQPGLALPLLALLREDPAPSGIHVAPNLPTKLIQAASPFLPALRSTEAILALIGRVDASSARFDCALTTLGVRYPFVTKFKLEDGSKAVSRGRLVPYADVPTETISQGGAVPSISFPGEMGKIPFPNTGSKGRDFVLAYLRKARPLCLGQSPPPEIDPAKAAELRTGLTVAAEAARVTTQLQANVRLFVERFFVVPTAFVTPALIVACVAVFGLMVIRGVSPLGPEPETMLAWGGLFGPSVLADGEHWRLLACLFLHYGFLHLLMNMIGLMSSGMMVERMFGHVTFAVVYLLSGAGGGIASLWYHPLVISAGASGAIFGVFGALIGVLIARRSDAPLTVFKPMAKGLTGFLGYNLVLGLAIPNIDMAAHVGGLLTGMVCGLAVGLAGRAAPKFRTPVKVVALLGLIACLAGLGFTALGSAKARLMADPEYARIRSAPEFNAFTEAVQPLLAEFDRIQSDRQKLLVDGDIPKSAIPSLEALAARSEEVAARLRSVPAANADLEAMRELLVGLAKNQKAGLERLAKFAKDRDPVALDGPNGLIAADGAVKRDVEAFARLRDQYMKKNDLKSR